jgi:hypothetical protein
MWLKLAYSHNSILGKDMRKKSLGQWFAPNFIILVLLTHFSKKCVPLILYHTFNKWILVNDWLSQNFDQANTIRQTKFNIRKNNQLKERMNILNNRFHEFSNVIPLDWFSMSINHFKISHKNLFLTNGVS